MYHQAALCCALPLGLAVVQFVNKTLRNRLKGKTNRKVSVFYTGRWIPAAPRRETVHERKSTLPSNTAWRGTYQNKGVGSLTNVHSSLTVGMDVVVSNQASCRQAQEYPRCFAMVDVIPQHDNLQGRGEAPVVVVRKMRKRTTKRYSSPFCNLSARTTSLPLLQPRVCQAHS